MTDKEKLNAIRAEVEKYIDAARKAHTNITEGNFAHLLSFIDSLQEEPKFKTGDKIKPVDSCLGSPRTIVDVCDSWYVTDQGTLDFECEDNWEAAEEPVSDDLEEAADSYIKTHGEILGFGRQTFKAGAKWQKEHMMKNAITARCFGFQSPDALFSIHLPAKGYLVGHELRVIIVKED